MIDNQKKYSKRLISTFEIISSYVVDLYFNHFYGDAKLRKTNGYVSSIDEGYKKAVQVYLHALKKKETFMKTIVGIHKYYMATTKYNNISFTEFVDEIVRHFMYDGYFDSSNNKQRDAILRLIIVNSIRAFSCDLITNNVIIRIINDRSKETIRLMQNKMLKSLLFEKENMFNKFFNKVNPDKKNDYSYKHIKQMEAKMNSLNKKHQQEKQSWSSEKETLIKQKEEYKKVCLTLRDKLKLLVRNNKHLREINKNLSTQDISINNTLPPQQYIKPRSKPKPVVNYEPNPTVSFNTSPKPKPTVSFNTSPKPKPTVSSNTSPEPKPTVSSNTSPEPKPTMSLDDEPKSKTEFDAFQNASPNMGYE